jgi:hypothetical protein
MNPKIISLISEKLPESFFHLGKASFYRLGRLNHHEYIWGLVEDMTPLG